MNSKISLVLNIILLLAVLFLFVQLNGKQDKEAETQNLTSETDSIKVYPSIAWVNHDSLNEKYKFIDDKSVELKVLEDEIRAINNQIVSKEQRYMQLAEKIQTHMNQGGKYDTEEAFYKDAEEIKFIESTIPEIQARLQRKYDALSIKNAEIADSLEKRVYRFIDDYSSNKPIDLILLYKQGLTGLYATDALDLTEEVITQLNAEYETDKLNAKLEKETE